MSRSLRSFLGNPLKIIEITETVKNKSFKVNGHCYQMDNPSHLNVTSFTKTINIRNNLLIVFLALKLRVKHKDLFTTKNPSQTLASALADDGFLLLTSVHSSESEQHEQGDTERKSNQCWELTI